MKEKLFGLLINLGDLEHYLIAQKILIKKISNNFEKFVIIDSSKIYHFPKNTFLDWFRYSNRSFDIDKLKEKIPSNFHIFQPKNLNEFEDFISKKDLVLIDNIEYQFHFFKIFMLIKKYNIKQIILSNISNNASFGRLKLIEHLNFFFGKTLSLKVYKLLCMINFFKQVDIRFDCNKNLFKYWTQSNQEKKFLISNNNYIKEFVLVNSRTYDRYHDMVSKKSEDYIVLIDANVNHPEDVSMRGKLNEEKIIEHYRLLEEFLIKLSSIYKKEVIVCIHPQYDLNETKNRFKNFKVFKGKTEEFIYKSSIVVLYESTMILDAFFLRKNIIVLKPDFPYLSPGSRYNELYLLPYLDLKNKENQNLNKNILDSSFLASKKKYDEFNLSHVKADNSDEAGTDKIIRVIKEKFFN